MSQHDMTVANGSGAVVRGDIEDALQALASCNLGATAPATTYQGMLWVDTSGTPLLLVKQFDGTDWITLGITDATNNLFRPALGALLPPPTGLTIDNFGADPTNDIQVAFTSCVLAGAGYPNIEVGPVTGTIQMDAASGSANRLDTGTFQADTWYYIWAQSFVTGTPIVVASASPTNPTMIASRTHKRLLGAFRSATGPALVAGRQEGNEFLYDGYQEIAAYTAAKNWTDLSVATRVPPISTLGNFRLYVVDATTVAIRRNGSANTDGLLRMSMGAVVRGAINGFCVTDSSQVIEVYSASVSTQFSISVNGFRLNIF